MADIFAAGKVFENQRGRFTILRVDEDKMVVQYQDSGEEEVVSQNEYLQAQLRYTLSQSEKNANDGTSANESSSYSYRPIGQLGIITNKYAETFNRERHLKKYLCDENGAPYFSDHERLSAYEIGKLDKWSEPFINCLTDGPKNEEEVFFTECAKGERVPRTISEQIINKLVYQALALGGLHYRSPYDYEDDYNMGDPLNDIDGLSDGELSVVIVIGTITGLI